MVLVAPEHIPPEVTLVGLAFVSVEPLPISRHLQQEHGHPGVETITSFASAGLTPAMADRSER